MFHRFVSMFGHGKRTGQGDVAIGKIRLQANRLAKFSNRFTHETARCNN